MIAAAMYGDPMWVRMRLDVFSSSDGLCWGKVGSVRQSDGNFNGTSMHSSSWGPMLAFDASNNTWMLSYVGYRGAPSNASGWLGNFDGRVYGPSAPPPLAFHFCNALRMYARYAEHEGDAGLDSDFRDGGSFDDDGDVVLLQPDDFRADGPWPHPCQGLQGTDSMMPYQLPDGSWAALVGTSHQETPNPWPLPSSGKWQVSLATSPSLLGPWKRFNPTGTLQSSSPSLSLSSPPPPPTPPPPPPLSPATQPADAPCIDFNAGFIENPVVSPRPDDAGYLLVHDALDSESSSFGVSCSSNGLQWAASTLVAIPGGCRTPFGLVPMTAAEKRMHRDAILDYGVVTQKQLDDERSALQWLFYSANRQGWEEVFAAVVYLWW